MNERNKNNLKNAFAGLFNKVFTILFPFILRTCLIRVMGVEYVGLNGLFTSILQVLSLAELGFSTAIVFSMYAPCAVKDYNRLSALLYFYKKIYYFVGGIIIVVGLSVIPVLPYVVKGQCPSDINIYLLYLIYLFNTGCGYFSFSYWSSLLYANQKSYVLSLSSTLCSSLTYLIQIVVILLTKSFYAYVMLTPVAIISSNTLNMYYAKKKYPEVKPQGTLSHEEKRIIWKKVYGLLWHKIGNTLIYSSDSIVISAVLGLAVLGRYNNYYYVYNSIASIFSILYSSITAGIGNSIIIKQKKKS